MFVVWFDAIARDVGQAHEERRTAVKVVLDKLDVQVNVERVVVLGEMEDGVGDGVEGTREEGARARGKDTPAAG